MVDVEEQIRRFVRWPRVMSFRKSKQPAHPYMPSGQSTAHT
jgi:hypothetical protein